MQMPSGRRSSEPMPLPSGQRDAAEQRGHGGHHDGTEAQQAGFVDGVGGVLAVLALGLQGEVHHHDAVLLHDADEQNDADDGDDAEILMEQHERQQRAHAGRRQRGENRDRVNEALVEHAEHDVDRHQRGQNQQRLIGERILERGSGALEAGLQAGRHVHLFLHLVDSGNGVAQRGVWRQIERDGDRRKLSLVIDGKRRVDAIVVGEGAERHGVCRRGTAGGSSRLECVRASAFDGARQRAGRGRVCGRRGGGVRTGGGRAGGGEGSGRSRAGCPGRRVGLDVQARQLARILLEFGQRFQDHVVLVELRVHGVDLALAVGVIERVVDGGRRDTQSAKR